MSICPLDWDWAARVFATPPITADRNPLKKILKLIWGSITVSIILTLTPSPYAVTLRRHFPPHRPVRLGCTRRPRPGQHPPHHPRNSRHYAPGGETENRIRHQSLTVITRRQVRHECREIGG